jgi:uncharacterized iron-regulated protein
MRGTSCENATDLALAQAIASTLAEGGIVVLGEVHDNPEHHRLRGAMISEAVQATRAKPAIVFEHIRADQQSALDRSLQNARNKPAAGSAAQILRDLDIAGAGWPSDEVLAPLVAAALAAGLPIVPGDPPRDRVRAVARNGHADLDAETKNAWRLTLSLEPKLQDALLTELEASHCGLMPKSAFSTMAIAQRYRDAHLAAQLVKAADAHGTAILLAGNGHVRSDRGVPAVLRWMAPKRKVLSVTLAETIAGKPDVSAYVPRDPAGDPATDFVVLTPPYKREDPCKSMRDQFGKKK